jgi:hypothetical protein
MIWFMHNVSSMSPSFPKIEWWYSVKNSRPNVDLTSPLVEEEHVLDKHHTSRLSARGEEAIENASAHERVKGFGGGAPDGRGQGDDEEVKHDGQTAKVSAQHHSYSIPCQFGVSSGKTITWLGFKKGLLAIPPAPSINTLPACE